MSDSALVIGGGIAGVVAALDLADAGAQVYLVEKSPSLGGRMGQLDKTFPTNDCSTCILSPKLVEAVRHPRIDIFTKSEVSECRGQAGNFKVKILKKARYVDESKCTGCGNCVEKCPAKVPSEYDCGMIKRRAIYIPFPQAVPLKYSIDAENCVFFQKGKCRNCEKVCTAGAVDFEQTDLEIEISACSIIVATGYDQFDPEPIKEYGYGEYSDVITALEFERMLSASGPTEGRIFRPSDGEVPRSITFIQCVGSRDENHNPYCSRVCCMYAIKEAMLSREHEETIEELNILYMDIRTFGKGFEEYYSRAKDESGLRFLRGRVSEVIKDDDGTMVIRYEDTQNDDTAEIETDMVVLSSALVPSSSNPELAGILGIELDENGFFRERHPVLEPVSSTKDGIFICGCGQGPKDIPDSVTQAQAASAKAVALVEQRPAEEEAFLSPAEESENDITEIEELRIGVFVCNCGINIGHVVDVKSVAAYARTLPYVVEAQENLFSCSESTQHRIQDAIREHALNRVVVAACTPRTHEPLFRETCKDAGINPYLFEMANIREHCSWVHAHDKEKATEKARQLIEMACARAGVLKPLTPRTMDVTQSALVLGGGIAGIQASLDISGRGIPTYLVEKRDRLGGRLNTLRTLSNIGENASEILEGKLDELEASRVTVLTNSEIETISGFVGNFDVSVISVEEEGKEKKNSLKVGAIVLALGSEVLNPQGRYDYDGHQNIITNLELEELLAKGTIEQQSTFTFILCVGAREKEGYTGCSRYCCQVAVKQARELRELGHDVNVLYRDMRTYDKGSEETYRQVSGLGVRFFRFDPNKSPRLHEDAMGVTVYDSLLQQDISLDTDYVVLVLPMTSPVDADKIQDILKIPRGSHGFFMEQHPKLAPLQTNTEGIFLCGTAQGPKNITESITQASGAASKAIALLSKRQLVVEAATACVDEALCWGCGKCMDVCEFGAPRLVYIDEEGRQVSRVNEALCKGCGMCAVYCPSGAMSPQHFTRDQILRMIEAFGVSNHA